MNCQDYQEDISSDEEPSSSVQPSFPLFSKKTQAVRPLTLFETRPHSADSQLASHSHSDRANIAAVDSYAHFQNHLRNRVLNSPSPTHSVPPQINCQRICQAAGRSAPYNSISGRRQISSHHHNDPHLQQGRNHPQTDYRQRSSDQNEPSSRYGFTSKVQVDQIYESNLMNFWFDDLYEPQPTTSGEQSLPQGHYQDLEELGPALPQYIGDLRGPAYRLHELNRKLSFMSRDCDFGQWQAFTAEFFDNDATLTIAICLENGPNHFTIGRSMIPRFFLSYFESGVLELQFCLKHFRENVPHGPVLDCLNGQIMSTHSRPPTNQQHHFVPHNGAQLARDAATLVTAEGRLIIEFVSDLSRIKVFSFAIRSHTEHVPRFFAHPRTGLEGPQKAVGNITRGGLPNGVLNYLRLCNMMTSMATLMSRQKITNYSAFDCLKAEVHDRFQRLTGQPQRLPPARASPPGLEMKSTLDAEFQKPIVKQRRRRKATDNPPAAQPKKAHRKNSQQPPNYEARRWPTERAGYDDGWQADDNGDGCED